MKALKKKKKKERAVETGRQKESVCQGQALLIWRFN